MAAKRNPAPRAAGRALENFNSLAALNYRENNNSLAIIQARHLGRLFGLAPTRAALVASLAFAAEARHA
jgi:hypothetical protein